MLTLRLSLGWENYTIKINHRKILDGIFKVAGVPEKLLRPISSAVDKLDKLPWTEVKKEMLEKSLEESVADKIGEWVKHKGTEDVLDLLKADAALSNSEDIKKGVEDMGLLFTYLTALGAKDKISFDLSLARGLDYYTGVIYEVVTEGSAPSGKGSGEAAVGVGSVAAGGRYDELVGMFSGKPIPCVGISFGVDRIIAIEKARKQLIAKAKEVDVYIMAFGGKGFTGMLPERMSIARQLWDAGIKVNPQRLQVSDWQMLTKVRLNSHTKSNQNSSSSSKQQRTAMSRSPSSSERTSSRLVRYVSSSLAYRKIIPRRMVC